MIGWNMKFAVVEILHTLCHLPPCISDIKIYSSSADQDVDWPLKISRKWKPCKINILNAKLCIVYYSNKPVSNGNCPKLLYHNEIHTIKILPIFIIGCEYWSIFNISLIHHWIVLSFMFRSWVFESELIAWWERNLSMFEAH